MGLRLSWEREYPYIGEGSRFSEEPVLSPRSRVDACVICTARLVMGENSVICSHAVLTGGGEVRLGRWCFVGYHSEIHTSTERYATSLVNAWWGETECDRGPVVFEDYSGVASGCIVFPNVVLPEGCAVGAGSIVTKSRDLRPWWIHLGRPAKPWKPRDKERILAMEKREGFLCTR